MQVFVNKKIIFTEQPFTILQLCSEFNITIPHFCYHPRLSIAANCRMCLVSTDSSTKPVASCAVTISNNLNVQTNTVLVKKARESVLEFLLINHPLDCPICDQGGECDLQDQTIVYGSDRGRFYEQKRAVKDIDLGPVVKSFMTRCIHCTRCIRFANEISKTRELGVIGRGNNTRISTFINKTLSSEISGNIVDLCPVGALTSKPYAFTARPWELRHFDTLDIFDSFGSNIRVDIRGSEIMRVLPASTAAANNEWITDKGRFFFDGLEKQRIISVLLFARRKKKFVGISWLQNFFLLSKLVKDWVILMTNINMFSVSKKFYFCLGNAIDLDSFYYLNRILSVVNSYANNVDEFSSVKFLPAVYRSDFVFSLPVDCFSKIKNLLLVAFNPRTEAALLNVKLNKFLFPKNVIFTIGSSFNQTFTKFTVGFTNFVFFQFLNGKNSICRIFAKPRALPLLNVVVIGAGTFSRKDQNTFNFFYNHKQNIIASAFHVEPFLSTVSQLHTQETISV